jgi:hypothetical protein
VDSSTQSPGLNFERGQPRQREANQGISESMTWGGPSSGSGVVKVEFFMMLEVSTGR